jgi:hypothetical protein
MDTAVMEIILIFIGAACGAALSMVFVYTIGTYLLEQMDDDG